MRHIISILALGATVTAALAFGTSPVTAASVPVGTQCARVPYGWAGSTSLSPGQSFSTGVVVPSEAGVQLVLAAHDVSTVDPAPDSVVIWIGGGTVADGLSVAGGEIAVLNGGSRDVTLTRVELSLDRCYQVASAGPVVATPDAKADLVAVNAPIAASTTVAAVPVAPTGVKSAQAFQAAMSAIIACAHPAWPRTNTG